MEDKVALQYASYTGRWRPLEIIEASDAGTVGPAQPVFARMQVFRQDAPQFDFVVGLNSDADALAASQTGQVAAMSRGYGFNGATFDRFYTLASSADAQVAAQVGLQGTVSRLQAYNGATFDRLRTLASDSDGQAATQAGLLGTVSRAQLYNGATFDRYRSASAANLAATSGTGAALTSTPGEWSLPHTPAANTQATVTKAAGGAGVRHVARSVTFSAIALATAAEATVLVNLRDGGTGAGTILWSQRVLLTASATNGSQVGFTLEMNVPGSANTAMTLEFAAAGGANTFESVSLTGFDAV